MSLKEIVQLIYVYLCRLVQNDVEITRLKILVQKCGCYTVPDRPALCSKTLKIMLPYEQLFIIKVG